MFGKSQKDSNTKLVLTPEEREYFEEFKACIEEYDEVSPGERNLFIKLALRLNITPQRTEELEKMAAGKYFTIEEEEYYNDLLMCIKEDGQVTETSSRILGKLSKSLNIGKERAEELEELALNEVED